jgi:WD40 repeat protein
MYLWSHTLSGTLTDPNSAGVRSVVFSADNKALVAADGNGYVYVWHIRTHVRSESLLNPGSAGVSSVAFDSRTFDDCGG